MVLFEHQYPTQPTDMAKTKTLTDIEISSANDVNIVTNVS